MKKCYKCGVEKDESEFHKDKSRKDGLSNKCKSCTSTSNKKWRESHREHLAEYRRKWREHNVEKTLQYAMNERLALREKIKSFKTKCVKCGEQRHYVIDFHHIDNSEKLFNINKAKDQNRELLVSEINKCVCLCRNCHSEFHYLYGIVPNNPTIALTEYLGANPYELTPNVTLEV